MLPRFHPLVRLTLAAVGALLVQGVVVAVISAALLVASRISHRPLTDFEVFAARNPLLLTVLVYPPTLLWLWFCRRFLDRQPFRSLGLRTPHSVHGFVSGALCGLLTLSLLFGVLWSCGFVKVNGFSAEFIQNGGRSVLVLAAYALAFCCVGFTEEVIFRGYVFHNLNAWIGLRAAIWTQAILFGLIHLANVVAKTDASGAQTILPTAQWNQAFWDARWGVCNIALIGVFFALAYLKTGSLWFPIGFHAAWNFALGCFFSLNVSGIQTFRVLDVAVGANTTATGGGFGAEGSAFLAAILAAMLWLTNREKDRSQPLADLALMRPQMLENDAEVAPDASELESEADDPTHVSRFRTSMRPLSAQPSLKLNRAEFDLAPSPSGFTPISQAPIANTSNADVPTQNAPLAPISASEIAVELPSENIATKNVPSFTPQVGAAQTEIIAPPVSPTVAEVDAISSTREPKVATTNQTSRKVAPVENTRLVEIPNDVTTGEMPPSETITESAPKPKKSAPKW